MRSFALKLKAGVLSLGVALMGQAAHAQDADGAASAANANNPLADIRAFNIQNYYIGELTGIPNKTANQFVLRYAQPLSVGNTNWLIRASLPYFTLPTGTGGSDVSGIGDFDIFAAYQFQTGNPAVSFGLGPQIVAPTGGSDVGSKQWQLGLANVLFDGRNPKFQYGYLLTYRSGIGDTNGRPRVSLGAFQPFYFYQLGQGWYTGGAPIWTYNFKTDAYSVPIGLRLGKVMKRNKTVFNLFVEPQYSVADRGIGQPKWQVYFALNMQFL